MKKLLLLTALLAYFPTPVWPQDNHRFVSRDYSEYYDWFQKRSQSTKLYENRTSLYIFNQEAAVHQTPHREAPVVTRLPIGHPVTNIAYPDYRLPRDEIKGYGDFWIHVSGTDAAGNPFRGFVWGADIAKGWRRGDITGDGQPEFIMMGLPSLPRRPLTEIHAEIRVLQNGHLLAQQSVPGLCLFEECDADALLRLLHYPEQGGLTIIEAATLTIGCEVGIDKAFLFWNGRRLECVFQAEYSTQSTTVDKKFSVSVATGNTTTIQTCRFSHEDEAYNPVWECQTIKVEGGPKKEEDPSAVIRAR